MSVVVACSARQSTDYLASASRAELQGAYHQAIKDYIKALSPNSDHINEIALFKLGFIHETYLKQYKQAVKYYTELLKRSTNRETLFDTQKRVARLYMDFLNEPFRAIETWMSLLNHFPGHPQADEFQYSLARAYQRMNKLQQARVEFQKVSKLYPQSKYIVRSDLEYAHSFFMEEDYATAEKELLKFVKRYPGEPETAEARFYLAHVYEENDNLRSAIEIYDELVISHPDRELIQMKLNRLRQRLAARGR